MSSSFMEELLTYNIVWHNDLVIMYIVITTNELSPIIS